MKAVSNGLYLKQKNTLMKLFFELESSLPSFEKSAFKKKTIILTEAMNKFREIQDKVYAKTDFAIVNSNTIKHGVNTLRCFAA